MSNKLRKFKSHEPYQSIERSGLACFEFPQRRPQQFLQIYLTISLFSTIVNNNVKYNAIYKLTMQINRSLQILKPKYLKMKVFV